MSKRERQRTARRRGRADQRERARRAEARANQVADPMTEPERAAELLAGLFGSDPVDAEIAARIVRRGDVGRARQVADAALRRDASPMALSLAADVALIDSLPVDAESFTRRALELADHPELHLRLAVALLSQSRAAAAVEALDGPLAANPGLEELQLARGQALEIVHEHARTAADRQVLDRFRDRTALAELHAAVGEYVVSSDERGEAFAEAVNEWVEVGAVTEEELEARTGQALLEPGTADAARLQALGEWAWLTTALDDGRMLLEAFAEDPAVAEDQRRRAADWLGWAMWGLWEIDRPQATPGVAMTELVTGVQLYAEVPPALLEGMPRWSVLLGCMVPVDGVWRAGGGFEVASPAEARALVHELVDQLIEHADEFGREGRPMIAWADRVHEHVGDLWLPASVEPPSPDALAGLHAALRAAVPSLFAGLRRMRGDGRDWFRVEVEDLDAAWEALAVQPDIELRDEDGPLTWFRGTETRALLHLDDDGLLVHLGLDEELSALLELLDRVGHPADSTEPLTSRHWSPVALPDGPADELASWLRAWPDEPLEALDGATPRIVLHRDGAGVEVEMLIRHLEHDADERGLRGLATEALRAQLGLGSGSARA